jgi:hypothetical protein
MEHSSTSVYGLASTNRFGQMSEPLFMTTHGHSNRIPLRLASPLSKHRETTARRRFLSTPSSSRLSNGGERTTVWRAQCAVPHRSSEAESVRGACRVFSGRAWRQIPEPKRCQLAHGRRELYWEGRYLDTETITGQSATGPKIVVPLCARP